MKRSSFHSTLWSSETFIQFIPEHIHISYHHSDHHDFIREEKERERERNPTLLLMINHLFHHSSSSRHIRIIWNLLRWSWRLSVLNEQKVRQRENHSLSLHPDDHNHHQHDFRERRGEVVEIRFHSSHWTIRQENMTWPVFNVWINSCREEESHV